MYIEFELPRGEYYGHVLTLIKAEIVSWTAKYNVPYSQKTIKYTHRLGFNNEEYFSLFPMTWTSDIPFKIINIANEQY
jgi:hypothetical protein